MGGWEFVTMQYKRFDFFSKKIIIIIYEQEQRRSWVKNSLINCNVLCGWHLRWNYIMRTACTLQNLNIVETIIDTYWIWSYHHLIECNLFGGQMFIFQDNHSLIMLYQFFEPRTGIKRISKAFFHGKSLLEPNSTWSWIFLPKIKIKMTRYKNRHLWTGLLLLALTVGTFARRGIFSSLDTKGELSYFKGAIAPTDLLCMKFYIGKKTTFPIQVPILTNVSSCFWKSGCQIY